MTLYEGPDFDVSYVKRSGSGDSAASVWEACTDLWYKGRVQLPPSNYRRIDVTLREPITSVRQLDHPFV